MTPIQGLEELKGKWKQRIGSAKIAWGRLTEDEMLKFEGRSQLVTGLIEERLAVVRADAGKQVNSFRDRFGA